MLKALVSVVIPSEFSKADHLQLQKSRMLLGLPAIRRSKNIADKLSQAVSIQYRVVTGK